MPKKNTNHDGVSKHGRRQRDAKAARYIPDNDFPLSVHLPSGRYYKTVRGKRYYFGKLDDGPAAALEAWLAVKQELLTGLTPAAWQTDDNVAVGDVLNQWVEAQHAKAEAGDITGRSFADYHRTAKLVADVLGRTTRIKDLTPDRFAKLGAAIKRDQSPTNAGKSITITKMAFRWAWENGVIPNPVRFGTDFKLPTKATRRAASRSRGRDIYTPVQVRTLLAAARDGVEGVAGSDQLYTMTLLGTNGGFTQLELAGLTIGDVDLDAGAIAMIRSKTGIQRTVPLWKETREAIAKVIGDRTAKDELVFRTASGNPWVREHVEHVPHPDNPKLTTPKLRRIDALNLQFRKLLKASDIKIDGAGFGRLRHTASTIMDALNDPNAKRRVLGQELLGIDSHYVASIGIDRLKKLTDHVHKWLWAGAKQTKTRGQRGTRK